MSRENPKRSDERHIKMLERRRDFLAQEIKSAGRGASSFDKAEHAALVWALEQLAT